MMKRAFAAACLAGLNMTSPVAAMTPPCNRDDCDAPKKALTPFQLAAAAFYDWDYAQQGKPRTPDTAATTAEKAMAALALVTVGDLTKNDATIEGLNDWILKARDADAYVRASKDKDAIARMDGVMSGADRIFDNIHVTNASYISARLGAYDAALAPDNVTARRVAELEKQPARVEQELLQVQDAQVRVASGAMLGTEAAQNLNSALQSVLLASFTRIKFMHRRCDGTNGADVRKLAAEAEGALTASMKGGATLEKMATDLNDGSDVESVKKELGIARAQIKFCAGK